MDSSIYILMVQDAESIPGIYFLKTKDPESIPGDILSEDKGS